MFTVFAKRIFVLQSASPCNAATVCFSYRLNSRLNDVVVESGGSLLPISLRRCISRNETQEPYGRILTFFVTSTRYGQGMVHDTQLNTAHRAIRSCSYRSYASGESTSSAILRKCNNLFARSSISFVTGSSIRSSSTSYSFSLLRTTWFDRF
jgi:hypothetical protein